MAERTDRIGIGSSIMYGIGRTPLVLANEIRDLDELAEGRLTVGLGNGTKRMIHGWHGQAPDAPAVRMEELVPLVRRILRLHEGPVKHEGRFYELDLVPTGEVAAPRRTDVPIITAGVRPRMIETAGRVADGLAGHPLFTPKYIEEVARPAVEKGAERAERSLESFQMISMVIAALHDDIDQARREAAAQIAFYSSVSSYAGVLDVAGFTHEGEQIRAAFADRDIPRMISAVTDDMIDAIAICGSTAEQIRDGLTRFDGCLDHVMLYSPSLHITEDRVHQNLTDLIDACAPRPTAARP